MDMSKADFAIAIWVILLVAFVGVKEIVWRKMEVTDMSPDAPWGKKVMERWHGNRPLGVLLSSSPSTYSGY